MGFLQVARALIVAVAIALTCVKAPPAMAACSGSTYVNAVCAYSPCLYYRLTEAASPVADIGSNGVSFAMAASSFQQGQLVPNDATSQSLNINGVGNGGGAGSTACSAVGSGGGTGRIIRRRSSEEEGGGGGKKQRLTEMSKKSNYARTSATTTGLATCWGRAMMTAADLKRHTMMTADNHYHSNCCCCAAPSSAAGCCLLTLLVPPMAWLILEASRLLACRRRWGRDARPSGPPGNEGHSQAGVVQGLGCSAPPAVHVGDQPGHLGNTRRRVKRRAHCTTYNAAATCARARKARG
jgi:hypothetical protein